MNLFIMISTSMLMGYGIARIVDSFFDKNSLIKELEMVEQLSQTVDNLLEEIEQHGYTTYKRNNRIEMRKNHNKKTTKKK